MNACVTAALLELTKGWIFLANTLGHVFKAFI